jgi:hypothetical protein
MCIEKDVNKARLPGAKHENIETTSADGRVTITEMWMIPTKSIEARIAHQEAEATHKAAVEANPQAFLGKKRMPTPEEIIASMSDDEKMRLLAKYAEAHSQK